MPGKSLNLGIEQSKGVYIVCLSAHSIPTENTWLASLVSSLEEDENYAGVYGRQEPMSFSPSNDKRDLLLVFGLDRIIKTKDSFFHNANSIIRRKCWEKLPFDSSITNIEDRIWAQNMLKLGYKLLYEPDSSVYHYHGIHQDGNLERVDSGDIPRKFQNKSLIGLHGLGCVTYPEFIRNGRILGEKIGLYEVEHPLAGFELRDDYSSDLAIRFLDKI